MLDFRALLEWAMALVAVLAVGGLVYRVIALVPKGRFLRCPETGMMSFVEMGLASPGDGSKPKLAVQGCDLWPQHYQCVGRCRVGQKPGTWAKWGLVQVPEAGARYGISPVALEACI